MDQFLLHVQHPLVTQQCQPCQVRLSGMMSVMVFHAFRVPCFGMRHSSEQPLMSHVSRLNPVHPMLDYYYMLWEVSTYFPHLLRGVLFGPDFLGTSWWDPPSYDAMWRHLQRHLGLRSVQRYLYYRACSMLEICFCLLVLVFCVLLFNVPLICSSLSPCCLT